METYELQELCRRKKSQCLLLVEVTDLTRQLGQALERKDEISAQMILGMRETPVNGLREIADGIDDYILSLPEESAIRGHELLTGAPPQEDRELPLSNEVARFQRLLQAVVDLDRSISLKVAGSKSVYALL